MEALHRVVKKVSDTIWEIPASYKEGMRVSPVVCGQWLWLGS